MNPKIPENESDRLHNLYEYNILDTLPEEAFNNIVKIASQICQTPISAISFIDSDRQWFKSSIGMEILESPRKISFCAHVLNEPNMLIIPDTSQDERFKTNPFVTKEPFIVFYAGLPIISSDGFALGSLCVIDKEPRRLSDNQLEALKALRDQVQYLLELRLTKNKLLEKNSELEGINKALDAFTTVAAHDIKSPIDSLSMAINLINLKYKEAFKDAQFISYFKILENNVNKIRKLIDDIMIYAKSSQALNIRENFEIAPFLKEIIQLIDPLGHYTFILPEKNFKICVNKNALERILINLITNAIRYNDKEKIEIKISAEARGKNYYFSVADNGPGIEIENQEKFFKMFERGTSKDRFGVDSTGIGLATVKKIIEALKGEISVSSEKSKGSIFSFNFPKN